MIYLASPYTHSDPMIVWSRYRAVLKYTADQLSKGVMIFSPIVYCHQMSVQYGMSGDWRTWETFDELMIKICQEFHILKLDGWDKSEGVAAEQTLANSFNKQIVFIEEE